MACLKYLPAVYLEKEEVCVSSTHRRDICENSLQKGWLVFQSLGTCYSIPPCILDIDVCSLGRRKWKQKTKAMTRRRSTLKKVRSRKQAKMSLCWYQVQGQSNCFRKCSCQKNSLPQRKGEWEGNSSTGWNICILTCKILSHSFHLNWNPAVEKCITSSAGSCCKTWLATDDASSQCF